MNRRGFLKAILAAGVAPAFVGTIMPVRKILLPEWGISRVAMPDVRAAQQELNCFFRNRFFIANSSWVCNVERNDPTNWYLEHHRQHEDNQSYHGEEQHNLSVMVESH